MADEQLDFGLLLPVLDFLLKDVDLGLAGLPHVLLLEVQVLVLEAFRAVLLALGLETVDDVFQHLLGDVEACLLGLEKLELVPSPLLPHPDLHDARLQFISLLPHFL